MQFLYTVVTLDRLWKDKDSIIFEAIITRITICVLFKLALNRTVSRETGTLIRYLRTALCTRPRLVERAFPLSTPLLLFVIRRFIESARENLDLDGFIVGEKPSFNRLFNSWRKCREFEHSMNCLVLMKPCLSSSISS